MKQSENNRFRVTLVTKLLLSSFCGRWKGGCACEGMFGNWKEKASPGLQLKYSETFLQLLPPPTTSPSECHSAVSNFKTELISLRAEPYYVIYRLYPLGRLSGGWLADAVLQFLPLSSALKGSESEGQPERRAAAPQGWSQRAQCHSSQWDTFWTDVRGLAALHHNPRALNAGEQVGETAAWKRGSFASEGLRATELKWP